MRIKIDKYHPLKFFMFYLEEFILELCHTFVIYVAKNSGKKRELNNHWHKNLYLLILDIKRTDVAFLLLIIFL